MGRMGRAESSSMSDFTQEQIERLARAVWPLAQAGDANLKHYVLCLKHLAVERIFELLIWLAKEIGEDPDELFDDSDVFSMLTAEDPKAAILRAAIEWNERKQGGGDERKRAS